MRARYANPSTTCCADRSDFGCHQACLAGTGVAADELRIDWATALVQ